MTANSPALSTLAVSLAAVAISSHVGPFRPALEAPAAPRRLAVNAASAEVGDALAGFAPGTAAPEIVGRDLDGNEMRLSDHRGKVVVLMFSADYCGICRTLEPYERFMLELYENWPFEILSVEVGKSPEETKQAKAEARLDHPSWWDTDPDGGAGPISAAWNVAGFPKIYVLDSNGVIRYVDLRYEDLLKAVRELLNEHVSAGA
jgi:thiol-disulfide isomerase/thioredoxin